MTLSRGRAFWTVVGCLTASCARPPAIGEGPVDAPGSTGGAAGGGRGEGPVDAALGTGGAADGGNGMGGGGGRVGAPPKKPSFVVAPTFESRGSSFVVGDLNNDGKLDVVAVGSKGPNVFLNDGNGRFGDSVEYPIAPGPSGVQAGALMDIAIGDFDGDGRPDLAITAAGLGQDSVGMVGVLPNVGNGAFGPGFSYFAGVDPASLTVGDYDGNGSLDIAIANRARNSVRVLLNAGHGTFTSSIGYPVGAYPVAITSGDVNGDGRPDLAMATDEGTNVLLNAGNGTFATPVTFQIPTGGGLALGDLDDNGTLDMAVLNFSSNSVCALLNDGRANFQLADCYPVVKRPDSIALADLDGDGKVDLFVGGQNLDVSVLFNYGNGTFGPAEHYYGGGTVVAIGDFQGDGRPDMIVGVSAAFNLLFNEGGRAFTAPREYDIPFEPDLVTVRDLNGDGNADLIVADIPGNVSVTLGRGGGVFAPSVRTGANSFICRDAVPCSADAVIGDLDDDGDDDIVVAISGPGGGTAVGQVRVLLNNGNGTFRGAGAYAAGAEPIAVAIADLDGDGRPDLAVANRGILPITGVAPSDVGDVRLLRNVGNGVFAAAVKVAAGVAPTSIAAADLDGDGRPDLAVASRGRLLFGAVPGTGTYVGGSLTVLVNAGDGSFTTTSSYPAGDGPFFVAIGDFDDDAKRDLAVLSAVPGDPAHRVFIKTFTNRGKGIFADAVNYDPVARPLGVAFGDFNGDGSIDLVTEGIGGVSVLSNNGDGTFAPAVAFPHIQVTSMAPGDLNGDGKLDLALTGRDGVIVLLNNTP